MKLRNFFFWSLLVAMVGFALPAQATITVNCAGLPEGVAPNDVLTTYYGNAKRSATASATTPSWTADNPQYTISPTTGGNFITGTYVISLKYEAKAGYRIINVESTKSVNTNTFPCVTATLANNKTASDLDGATITITVAPTIPHSATASINIDIVGDGSNLAYVKFENEPTTQISKSATATWETVVDKDRNEVSADNNPTNPNFNYTFSIVPATTIVQVNWELVKDGNVVKSGSVSGEETEISLNTVEVSGDATLRYTCVQVVEESASVTHTLNFDDGGFPEVLGFGWKAEGNDVEIVDGTGEYTHNYIRRLDGDEVQNPFDEYYQSEFTISMQYGYQAQWQIVKDEVVVARGKGYEPFRISTKNTDFDGGTLKVVGVSFRDDVTTYGVQITKEHFASIQCGVKNKKGDFEYTDLLCNDEGLNLYPNVASNNDYKIRLEPKANVEFTIIYHKADGTTSTAYSNQLATKEFSPLPTTLKGGYIEVESSELMEAGETWSFTIKADPEYFTIKDNVNKVNNANVMLSGAEQLSLEGITYTPTDYVADTQFTQIYIGVTKTHLLGRAYFYPAGVDTSDPANATIKSDIINLSTTGYSAFMQKKMSNARANGGTLVVELVSTECGSGTITVNVDGNPSEMKMAMATGNNYVTLVEGENQISLNSPKLWFFHEPNSVPLAKITRNGEDMREKSNGLYSYETTMACGGDVYDIIVAFNDVKHPVYIEVPEGCEDFVSDITVAEGEGAPVSVKADWVPGQPIMVQEGQNVRVVGDTYYFKVNSSYVDDVVTPDNMLGFNLGKSKVKGECHIGFNVVRIPRDKTMIVNIDPDVRNKKNEVPSGATVTAKIVTAQGSIMNLVSGKQYTVAFSDADQPIQIVSSYTSSDKNDQDTYLASWKINGLDAAFQLTTLQYRVANGDNIYVKYAVEDTETTKYNNVVYITLSEGLTERPTIKVNGSSVFNNAFVTNPGDEISVSSTSEVEVYDVKVNRTSADVSGTTFTYESAADATIEIYGRPWIESPKFTIFISGNPQNLGLFDGEQDPVYEDVELTAGENVLELDALVDGTLYLMQAPGTDAFISAITYNDADIFMDEEYYMPYQNGMYMLTVEEGDYIDLTILPALPRENVLHVYVDGMDKMMGCSVGNTYNFISLVEDEEGNLGGSLAEGVNTVRFNTIVDLPLNFQCNGLLDSNDKVTVYLGKGAVDEYEGAYMIDCVDGQTLYVVAAEDASYEAVELDMHGFATYVSHNNIRIPKGDEELKAFIATSFDDKFALQFMPVDGVIPAGTGLLIKGEANGVAHLTIDSVPSIMEIALFNEEEEEEDEYSIESLNIFHGAYKHTTIDGASDYAQNYVVETVGEKIGLTRIDEPTVSATNQAYVTVDKAEGETLPERLNLSADFLDQVTGIEAVAVEISDSTVYNLHGVKVADKLQGKTLAPGIYIVNGHKVVVR